MFYGAVMKFRIIEQSAQYTNALLKIFVQKTTLLILFLIITNLQGKRGD